MITIVFDLVTFAGIFVAIGHDSNANTECTSGNGLCKGATIPDCTNNVPATLQCGTVTVTVSAGTTSGQIGITFSTTFASKPNITLTPLNNPAGGSYSVPYSFEAVGNAFDTWASMPSAETYLYATAQACCTLFSSTGTTLSSAQCNMEVNVIVASTSATAVLIPRFSTSSATGPWTDVGTGVNIHTTGFQQVSVTFPSITSSLLWLSPWGQNGGGVGDSPQFGAIQLVCNLFNNAWSWFASGISTTGFTVAVVVGAAPFFDTTVKFNWEAING